MGRHNLLTEQFQKGSCNFLLCKDILHAIIRISLVLWVGTGKCFVVAAVINETNSPRDYNESRPV